MCFCCCFVREFCGGFAFVSLGQRNLCNRNEHPCLKRLEYEEPVDRIF